MLNISPVPSIFKASPEDDQVFKSAGYRGIPGDLTNAVEVVVDINGQGDFLTIEEGLAFLGANPGVIHIKAGTYTITSRLELQEGQELRGSGYGTKIYTTANIQIIYSTADKVGVYNLRVQGNSTGASQDGILFGGDECVIRDCWFIDLGHDGINLGASNRNNIDGCIIQNTGYRGILFNATDLSIISNCEITQCDEQGIYLSSTALYNVIIGNNIHNNGDGDVEDGGVLLKGNCFQNMIMGNSVRDHAGANEVGINLVDSGGAPNENLIMGNILQNNTTNFVDGGTSTQIGHNISS